GYYEEAQAWRDWLTRAIAGRPEQMGVMYGVSGERRLTEWEVSWLPGYENSAPVRIGNAAHEQLQLDVFGEVMDTLHQGRRGGLAAGGAGGERGRVGCAECAAAPPRHALEAAGSRHLGVAHQADALHLFQGDV